MPVSSAIDQQRLAEAAKCTALFGWVETERELLLHLVASGAGRQKRELRVRHARERLLFAREAIGEAP